MINTLNETHLHKTLKAIYASENEGSVTEQPVGDYIADVVTKNGDVIEIQTGSLGHLIAKIMYYIEEKRSVTVVYPLPCVKYIETTDFTSGKVSRRKSPKKQNLYSMFRELTALCPVILNRRFTLEVIESTVTEERKTTEDAVQSKNGRRRFPKKWLKTGKRLESVGKKHVFHGKSSYRKLIPKGLEDEFSARDLYNALKDGVPGLKMDNIRLMIWVYVHAEIMECTGKKGRSSIYRLK
ncbi:MAG TPA: hypothetical protein DCM57_06425 [Treponema sp.]|jgi:hypothetical protein|nr:hypothetical protein [Treponema sp.]HBB42004.1 hypothetical protein [Treponema sp.]